MSSFLYLPRASFIHRLHPATKIAGLVLLFVPPLAFNHPVYVAACLAASLILLGLADCLDNVARIWRFGATIFVFATIMWTLFADMPFGFPLTAAQVRYEIGLAWGTALSDPKVYIPLLAAVVVLVASRWGSSGAREFPALLVVAALGWTLHHVHTEAFTTMEGSVDVVSCSRQGWDSVPSGELVRPFSLYALAMGLRINAFLAAGLLLISTTRVEAFAAGLRSLGLPPPMCFALSLGFRLMPTYADTAITVVQAQRSRGQDFDRGGVIQRLRRYVPLLVPVLAYALRRADGLAMALESKGFSAARRRTEFLPLRFTLADLVVLVVLVAVAAGSIWARSTGHGVVLDRL